MNIPRTILLIGKNPHWLDETIAMFERTEHIVLAAQNGIEGFRIAQCDVPDLIICEFLLSDMSGIELCQFIRNDQELCRVPILLVNEYQQDIDQVIRDLEIGVDDYLTACYNFGLPSTKQMWLTGKHSESYLELSYQILFLRQHHLTEIIKDTTGLIKALSSEYRLNNFSNSHNQDFKDDLDKRIEVGMNIIDGLTCLLNEQTNSLINLAQALETEEYNMIHNSTQPNESYSHKSSFTTTKMFQNDSASA